jgi:Mrp family chromosome partitioning ATPase
VLSSGGTQILARHADAVMLVTRADVKPRPAVSEAVDALARIPAPPIGLVLAS